MLERILFLLVCGAIPITAAWLWPDLLKPACPVCHAALVLRESDIRGQARRWHWGWRVWTCSRCRYGHWRPFVAHEGRPRTRKGTPMQGEMQAVPTCCRQSDLGSLHERYGYTRLLEALTEQWRICPPVYIRPTFWLYAGVPLTFHFVLRRGEQVNLISVLDCSAVRQFVEEQALEIDGICGADDVIVKCNPRITEELMEHAYSCD